MIPPGKDPPGEVLFMERQAHDGSPPGQGSRLPQSLPAWLPFLWSRVLFPGAPAPADGPPRPAALLVLFVVPALALHGCVLAVYLFGRRSLGERAAFRGALLLALAPGFTGMGRLLLMDGLLTLCATLALFSAFEAVRGPRLRWGWWLLAGSACGLGVLTKGP